MKLSPSVLGQSRRRGRHTIPATQGGSSLVSFSKLTSYTVVCRCEERERCSNGAELQYVVVALVNVQEEEEEEEEERRSRNRETTPTSTGTTATTAAAAATTTRAMMGQQLQTHKPVGSLLGRSGGPTSFVNWRDRSGTAKTTLSRRQHLKL